LQNIKNWVVSCVNLLF